MEMQVNSQLIRAEREKRAWSQSHLADVTNLGLRTIQRIEGDGRASYESAAAIAAALSVTVSDLMAKDAATGKRRPAASAATAWAVAGVTGIAALLLALLHWLPQRSEPADFETEPGLTSLPEPQQDSTVPDVNVIPGCSSLSDERLGPNMHRQLECESRDPDWATETEDLLRNAAVGFLEQSPSLDARFDLTRVRCRSTICELQFLDDTPTNGFTIDSRGNRGPEMQLTSALRFGLQDAIYDEPWGAQFNPWRSTGIGSAGESGLQLWVYLQTTGAESGGL